MKLIDTFKRKAASFFSGGKTQIWNNQTFRFNTPTSSLDNSTIVSACLGWLSRNFVEPPFVVETLEDNGEITRDFNHPLVQLLRNPNVYTKLNDARLWKATVYSRFYDGNAYWNIIKNSYGYPVALEFIPVSAIKPIPDDNGFLSGYLVRTKNGYQKWEIDDVVHFADGIDEHNPLLGCSELKKALRLVLTDELATAYAQRTTSNLGAIGLVVSPKDGSTIDEVQAEALNKYIQSAFSGEGQGASFVPSIPVDIEYIGADPSKMMLKEIQRIPEERISAIIGTPAVVVGLGAGLDRSTFSNMAEAREAATEQLLIPLWKEFCNDITVQLGSLFGLAPNQSITRDLTKVRVLQEDENAKWERLGVAYQRGGITRGEYRTGIGFEASNTDDVYYIEPSGMAVKALKSELLEKAKTRRATYDSMENYQAQPSIEGEADEL